MACGRPQETFRLLLRLLYAPFSFPPPPPRRTKKPSSKDTQAKQHFSYCNAMRTRDKAIGPNSWRNFLVNEPIALTSAFDGSHLGWNSPCPFFIFSVSQHSLCDCARHWYSWIFIISLLVPEVPTWHVASFVSICLYVFSSLHLSLHAYLDLSFFLRRWCHLSHADWGGFSGFAGWRLGWCSSCSCPCAAPYPYQRNNKMYPAGNRANAIWWNAFWMMATAQIQRVQEHSHRTSAMLKLSRTCHTDSRDCTPLRRNSVGFKLPWGHLAYEIAKLGLKTAQATSFTFSRFRRLHLSKLNMAKVCKSSLLVEYSNQYTIYLNIEWQNIPSVSTWHVQHTHFGAEVLYEIRYPGWPQEERFFGPRNGPAGQVIAFLDAKGACANASGMFKIVQVYVPAALFPKVYPSAKWFMNRKVYDIAGPALVGFCSDMNWPFLFLMKSFWTYSLPWTWRQALACSIPSCKKGVAGMTLRISSTWTATFYGVVLLQDKT